MSHRLVKTHVKVILVDLFFARLTEKLYWSVLCLMEADVAKKESLEFTEKLTFTKIGSKQVNQKDYMDVGDGYWRRNVLVTFFTTKHFSLKSSKFSPTVSHQHDNVTNMTVVIRKD